MSRVIIKLNSGEYINIPAEQIDIREDWICAWNGEDLVAIAKAALVDSCHLIEKEVIHNGRG